MADWSPIFLPGSAITTTASAAINGGQLVEITGSDTVGPAAAGSRKVVGVAAFDAAANQQLTIFGRGTVHMTANQGGVTAGDQLVVGSVAGTVATMAAASGATATDVNNARSLLGIAMTTGADTTVIQWMEC